MAGKPAKGRGATLHPPRDALHAFRDAFLRASRERLRAASSPSLAPSPISVFSSSKRSLVLLLLSLWSFWSSIDRATMGDAYWRYAAAEARQQQALPSLAGKRPRSDYDIPLGHELPGYFPREGERGGYRVSRDAEVIGASYDRYIRNGMSSYGGAEFGRPLTAGIASHPVDDRRMMAIGSLDPGIAAKSQYGSERSEIPLSPDASNTLFVEGLPAGCTRREVSHIFRPFVGFKEVRLVSKESKRAGGDPLILCFVDFASPSHAATALDALQGYKFDVHDRDSSNLRLQFARFPGPRSGGGQRSGGGSRGRR